MRISCPYCDCHYDIHPDTLGNPIGSEKLGFGWWLRCYQCQKKFWLKSTTVIDTGFAPFKADKVSTISRLSKLSRHSKLGKFSRFRKKQRGKSGHNGILYILIITLATMGGVCYTHIDEIREFFITKVKHFTASTIVGLQLTNIVYRIDKVDGQYRISVIGNIVNNTQSVLQCNGLHIVVLSENKEITSWDFVPEPKSIIPGDKIAFSTEKNTVIEPKEPKILVRIIN